MMAEYGRGAQFRRSRSVIRSLSLDGTSSGNTLEVDHAKHLVQNLGRIRRDDEHIDVTLIVGQVRIKGHKVVLAAFSPYFKALFKPAMLESARSEIELHDLNGLVVEKLVDFAYTGKISYSNDTVQEILETANFLDVVKVRHDCAKFIAKQLDSQNFAEIYALGRQLGEEIMFKSAMSYCMQNFTMMSKTQEFLTMPADMLEEILKSESLQYHDPGIVPIPANQEYGVIDVIMNKYMMRDTETRIALLPAMLSHLRLPTLLPAHFTQLREHPLVKDSQDSLSIVNKAAEIAQKRILDPARATNSTEPWLNPRDNKLLVMSWSRTFAGGGQIYDVVERYDDSEKVPNSAHMTGIKTWSRRWDGRQILGGYEMSFSNGVTVTHGATNLNYEVYEFKLAEGEVILSMTISSGWCIDQLTFHTSNNRTFGPFGGDGGGLHQIRHLGRDANGGYLSCTQGAVAKSQGEQLITCLQFKWMYWKPKDAAKDGTDQANSDSGEDMYDDAVSDDDDYEDEDVDVQMND